MMRALAPEGVQWEGLFAGSGKPGFIL